MTSCMYCIYNYGTKIVNLESHRQIWGRHTHIQKPNVFLRLRVVLFISPNLENVKAISIEYDSCEDDTSDYTQREGKEVAYRCMLDASGEVCRWWQPHLSTPLWCRSVCCELLYRVCSIIVFWIGITHNRWGFLYSTTKKYIPGKYRIEICKICQQPYVILKTPLLTNERNT